MSDDDIEGRAGRLKAAFPGTFTEDGSGFVSFDVDAIRKVIGWGERIDTQSGVTFERSRDCIWVHVKTQVGNSIGDWSWRVTFEEWDRVVLGVSRDAADRMGRAISG